MSVPQTARLDDAYHMYIRWFTDEFSSFPEYLERYHSAEVVPDVEVFEAQT